jgi:hypothetical protein
MQIIPFGHDLVRSPSLTPVRPTGTVRLTV